MALELTESDQQFIEESIMASHIDLEVFAEGIHLSWGNRRFMFRLEQIEALYEDALSHDLLVGDQVYFACLGEMLPGRITDLQGTALAVIKHGNAFYHRKTDQIVFVSRPEEEE